jgi:hypothetical protein
VVRATLAAAFSLQGQDNCRGDVANQRERAIFANAFDGKLEGRRRADRRKDQIRPAVLAFWQVAEKRFRALSFRAKRGIPL